MIVTQKIPLMNMFMPKCKFLFFINVEINISNVVRNAKIENPPVSSDIYLIYPPMAKLDACGEPTVSNEPIYSTTIENIIQEIMTMRIVTDAVAYFRINDSGN